MPKSPLRIVRISWRVALRVMSKMIRRPLEHGVLKRPPAGDQQRHLDTVGTVKAPMRGKPVVSDRNSQPRDDVQGTEHRPVESRIPVHIAKGRDDDDGAGRHDAEKDRSPDSMTRSGDGDRSSRERDHAGIRACPIQKGASACRRPLPPLSDRALA